MMTRALALMMLLLVPATAGAQGSAPTEPLSFCTRLVVNPQRDQNGARVRVLAFTSESAGTQIWERSFTRAEALATSGNPPAIRSHCFTLQRPAGTTAIQVIAQFQTGMGWQEVCRQRTWVLGQMSVEASIGLDVGGDSCVVSPRS